MELRQLEYFVAVAREASFTRAAGKLHVAQPGVSAQVRQLERELGQRLLDRSGRSVTLTEVGAAVLPHARAALEAVSAAREAVQELSELERGRVAVGMVSGCGAIGLPDLLADFHDAHPGIEISLVEDSSDQLLRGVRGGTLDLALVGRSGPASDELATQVIIDEALVAAVCLDHPLAARTTIALEAFKELGLISLPRGTGLRSALDQACAAAGFEPVIAFEAADPKVLGQLAGRGLGVAILPESSVAADPALHGLEITRPRLRGRIELVWRAEGSVSPAARALVQAGQAFF